MYTADMRAADRTYLCLNCGARPVVGPCAQWRTIAELKEAGCPACGEHRLRPWQLASRNG
jgi:DNA-directed RNA polymerase subunit RPC12/RpoP